MRARTAGDKAEVTRRKLVIDQPGSDNSSTSRKVSHSKLGSTWVPSGSQRCRSSTIARRGSWE